MTTAYNARTELILVCRVTIFVNATAINLRQSIVAEFAVVRGQLYDDSFSRSHCLLFVSSLNGSGLHICESCSYYGAEAGLLDSL
jgi:hypothetical protein